MKQIIIFTSSLILVSILLVYAMSNNLPTTTHDATQAISEHQQSENIAQFSELADKVSDLVIQLEFASNQRKILEQKIAKLEWALKNTTALPRHREDEKNTNSENTITAPTSFSETGVNNTVNPNEALTLLGLTEADIDQIEQRVAEDEMSLIRLRNQAMREDWYGSKRWFEESAEIGGDTNIYREELGDHKYDRYLFQTGQSNRVTVQSIIPGSPGAEQALQEGDIVYSYDDNRVFRWSDLTSATSSGAPGETVEMRILRNEEMLEIYLPRGPIGVRLTGAKINPDD